VHRHRVSGDDGHPDAGRGDPERGQAEDLARLVADLQLLGRPAVRLQRARPRHHVHGQRRGEGPEVTDRRTHVAGPLPERPGPGHLVELRVERVDPGLAGARGRLVRGDDHLLKTERPVQRAHRHDHRQRGAVRVRDDALGPVRQLFRVDLRHHQGDLRVHPEGARVVDGHRAVAGRHRRPRRRHLVGHVEHGHVDAVERVRRERHHLGLAAPDRQPPPGRPRRGDQPDISPDVLPGGQQVEHHRADRAGGTDHGQRGPEPGSPSSLSRPSAAHRPVPP
jgi:hypothetical protein